MISFFFSFTGSWGLVTRLRMVGGHSEFFFFFASSQVLVSLFFVSMAQKWFGTGLLISLHVFPYALRGLSLSVTWVPFFLSSICWVGCVTCGSQWEEL